MISSWTVRRLWGGVSFSKLQALFKYCSSSYVKTDIKIKVSTYFLETLKAIFKRQAHKWYNQ